MTQLDYVVRDYPDEPLPPPAPVRRGRLSAKEMAEMRERKAKEKAETEKGRREVLKEAIAPEPVEPPKPKVADAMDMMQRLDDEIDKTRLRLIDLETAQRVLREIWKRGAAA